MVIKINYYILCYRYRTVNSSRAARANKSTLFRESLKLERCKVRVTQNFNCSTKYIRIDLLLFIFYISVSHGCRNTYIFVLSQPQILGHHTELVCCSIIKLTGLVVEEHVLRRCCSNCDTSTQQTLVMEASFFGMLFEM